MTDTFFEVKSDTHRKHTPVIPAEAGIQSVNPGRQAEPSAWIPGRAALARNDDHTFQRWLSRHQDHTPVIPAEAGIQGINLGDDSDRTAPQRPSILCQQLMLSLQRELLTFERDLLTRYRDLLSLQRDLLLLQQNLLSLQRELLTV